MIHVELYMCNFYMNLTGLNPTITYISFISPHAASHYLYLNMITTEPVEGLKI